MDFLSKFRRQISQYFFLILMLQLLLMLGVGWLIRDSITSNQLFAYFGVMGLLSAIVSAKLLTASAIEPADKLWGIIQHVSPHGESQAMPDLTKMRFGRDMVSTLANHIYQLANVVDSVSATTKKEAQDIHSSFIANSLPLPLIVTNKDDDIVYVNEAAAKYLKVDQTDLSGQNLYTALDMSFTSEETLDFWLSMVKEKSVTAEKRWERVRIGLPGQNNSKQFDMAAHYNQSNSMGYETIIVLFDHTEIYSQDDQAMSFVALSVHELRTPLTLLRGYIEVFDDEVGPTLNPEMQGFMKKMDAAAQQLAAFVDNILNVAKIEDNQLTLQLHEENWNDVLQTVINDLSLRAAVRDVTIKADIAEGLPTVGVDRYSIYEVVANLLDNAIKYSKGTKEIYLSASLNKDGLVETSIKDFGLGIDVSILPHVFDKFYRNHRNRAQIGGTGLGLYLSRAIVEAHGGQIWVSSKVDQGSTFSFSIIPYAKLTEVGKTGTASGIARGAHGWIKNHSLYRD